jgi:hypothetical protein
MTEHFSFNELTDSENHPELVVANRVSAQVYLKQLKYVAATLEEVRAVLGVPMKVTSGFRNPALNKAVGGSATSGHTLGLCADFKPIGMEVKEAFKLIKENKHLCPSLKKCIYENIKGSQWLHIESKTDAGQFTQFYTTTTGRKYDEVV